MKKAAICTIFDTINFGNRLQNYATQEVLRKLNIKTETIINLKEDFNLKYYLRHVKNLLLKKKYYNFNCFNKNIVFSKSKINFSKDINIINNYDYYVVGSDQVWNPNFLRLNNFDLLSFTNSKNKISFAASFGISTIPKNYHEKIRKEFLKFKAISVREDSGKKIVEELTGRKDVEVLVDPTMLLTSEEWNKVSKKPKMLKTNKYILNYFLGNLSNSRKKEIERVAKENNCEVINILDSKSPYYACGPSEFLYLEKHAFLICTDSFHSSVFAIIYNKPFIVFDREQEDMANMNSRIETLLNKFDLTDRKYNGKITDNLLNHDYSKAYKILENERIKASNFLKKALDIEKE